MTHLNVNYALLEDAAKALLQERFQNVEIVSVHIDNDVVDDDDRVFEVSVTFRGSLEAMVRGRPPGLVGLLRSKFAELHENAFPVLNFIPN